MAFYDDAPIELQPATSNAPVRIAIFIVSLLYESGVFFLFCVAAGFWPFLVRLDSSPQNGELARDLGLPVFFDEFEQLGVFFVGVSEFFFEVLELRLEALQDQTVCGMAVDVV